jgi:hypothetical protein
VREVQTSSIGRREGRNLIQTVFQNLNVYLAKCKLSLSFYHVIVEYREDTKGKCFRINFRGLNIAKESRNKYPTRALSADDEFSKPGQSFLIHNLTQYKPPFTVLHRASIMKINVEPKVLPRQFRSTCFVQ